jgi:hypothetical protein
MPTVADLKGAWVGEAGGAYFLLEIDADSSGVLVVEFIEGRGPSAWRVRSVSIVKRRIEFRLEPTDPGTESVFLRGTGCREQLYLDVGSMRPNWKWNVTLRPRDVLRDRLRAVSEKAAAVKRPRK